MRRRAVVLAACLATLGAAGCSTPEVGTAPSTTRSTEVREVARPKDRDQDAVLAALRQLDLCAVLEKAKVGGPFAEAQPVAWQPFECGLRGADDLITVRVMSISHPTLVRSETVTLGGAKAHVTRDSGCEIHFLVSFTTALTFSQPLAPGCDDATALAAATAEVLANPDTVRAEPTWDACTVLADVLDVDAGTPELVGSGLVDCTNHSRESTVASVSFADDLPPSDEHQPRTTTIAGTQVRIYDDGEHCEVHWRHGPFDVSHAATPDHGVVVRTPDCARSTELTEALMTVLGTAPPTDVAPQRPLLYAPDEPDSAYPGACAHVDELDPNRCEPYVEVPVPDDPAEILSAAAADAHVQCALAVRSVGTHFGPTPVPVADSASAAQCFFVEPERQLQLSFSLSSGRVVNRSEGRPVTVAGHPGYVTSEPTSIEYVLSTGAELDGAGAVALLVSTGPANAGTLAPGTDGKAAAVLGDVLGEYFS